MFSFIRKIKLYFDKSIRSIAFYPSVIAVFFIFLAFVILSVEQTEKGLYFKELIRPVLINNTDTARTILSTLIGGIISLTVFSFTMVMVVLNQASSNYSPRLLPGLISNKKHQIVLGTYIGSFLYCILILISVREYENPQFFFGLSITIAVLLGIFCMVAFIYFIHTISRSIQIQNITKTVYQKAKKDIEKIIDIQRQASHTHFVRSDTSEWQPIYANQSGYYQGFDYTNFDKKSILLDTEIEILPYANQYVYKGQVIIRSKKFITPEEQLRLQQALSFTSFAHDGKGFYSEMIKLMEIAVKAMSPGINDPGTALNAVQYSYKLLRKYLQLTSYYVHTLDHNNRHLRVYTHLVPLPALLQTVFQPIRQYAKHDVSLMNRMVTSVYQLYSTENNASQTKEVWIQELNALKYDIFRNIKNEYDREFVFQNIPEFIHDQIPI